MVQTEGDYNALAWLMAVNDSEVPVIDMLVKPKDKVTWLKTEHSGIDEEMMASATKTLQDAHEALRKHIRPGTIIVGHDLTNDFRAMRFAHPWIIDTALLYPLNDRGGRSGLKELVKKHFREELRPTGKHNPFDDAKAALRLAKLFMDDKLASDQRAQAQQEQEA